MSAIFGGSGTATVRTNTAAAKYIVDSTQGAGDDVIQHNRTGLSSYVMPSPTVRRTLTWQDITGTIGNPANWCFLIPFGGEQFNGSAGLPLSGGSTFHFTNSNATVTATGSKFLSELAVGMSIASSNRVGFSFRVSAIASDISLTIDQLFTGSTTTTATATRNSISFIAPYGKLVAIADGTNWWVRGDGTPSKLLFTATGIAVFPPGVAYARLYMAGNGGSGGGGVLGVANTTGGGGGGAAMEIAVDAPIVGNTSYAVTIPAAAAGGAVNANGNPGGDVTFDVLATARGASGGSAGDTVVGVAGGGLAVQAAAAVNQYAEGIATVGAASTAYFPTIAGGGGAGNLAAGSPGSRNPNGGFEAGAGGSAGTGGGGGGGSSGPRGAGGAGGNGGAVATVGADAPANSAAGGGGGGSSPAGGTPAAGGAGGTGYADAVFVL